MTSQLNTQLWNSTAQETASDTGIRGAQLRVSWQPLASRRPLTIRVGVAFPVPALRASPAPRHSHAPRLRAHRSLSGLSNALLGFSAYDTRRAHTIIRKRGNCFQELNIYCTPTNFRCYAEYDCQGMAFP